MGNSKEETGLIFSQIRGGDNVRIFIFDVQDLFVGLCEIFCQNTIIYTNLSLVIFHSPSLSRGGGLLTFFQNFEKPPYLGEGVIYGGVFIIRRLVLS